MDKNEVILENYKNNKKTFDNFAQKLEILLKELFDEKDVNYQNISTRTKDTNSLTKKVESKNKYSKLEDITDLVGCRIIAYFEDDVEKIIQIIKEEFIIDEKNSIDKKQILEPDRFGYLSYHIICSISDTRKKLSEYKKYENIKFEIQIRTILQHAWAEIEHDIGYKSNIQVPKQFQRRFSRIAGLLEMVDDEFSRIKNEILTYTTSLTTQTVLDTDINVNSLDKYLEDNELIQGLDKYFINKTNASYMPDYKNFLEIFVEYIKNYSDFEYIKDLDKFIKINELIFFKILDKILELFPIELEQLKELTIIPQGMSLIYILLIYAISNNNKEILRDFLPDTSIKEKEFNEKLPKLIEFYKKITKN